MILLLHENAPTHFVARQSFFGRDLKHRIASLLEPPLPERTFTMRKTLLVLGTVAILCAALFRVEFVDSREPATVSPQNVKTGDTVTDSQQVELRLTVTDEEKRPLPGTQVELIYGADNLYSQRFETDSNGVGTTKIPIAVANTETQGWITGKEKGMTGGFSLWNIPKDWNPSKPLEMSMPVYKNTRILTGTVVDADGKPVVGALVGNEFCSLDTRTDEKGRFEFYCFDRPIETLFAFKEGVGGVAISPDYEDNPADKWKAQNPEGVEEWRKQEKHNNGPFTLKLSKGKPISIRVVNHEGNPIEGALVAPTSFSTDSRYTKEIRSWNAWNLSRHWGKKTDANGMVQFDSIPTEGYDMVCFDAFGDDPRFVKEGTNRWGKGNAIWRLRENNNDLVISLPRRILIEGSVRNADGTVPGSMQISVNGLTGWGSVGTHMDYAGNFTFFVNAHEVISVQPIYNQRGESESGVAPARLNVPVGNGWSTPAPRFDFVLEKGTKVTGKIITKDAKTDGAKTFFQVYDGAAGGNEMTNMNRLFVITNLNAQREREFDMRLPNGRYRVKVQQMIAEKLEEKAIDQVLEINGQDEIRFDLEL